MGSAKEMRGRLIGVYSGARKAEGKQPIEAADLVEGVGLAGDGHAGSDAHRQISLFASETLRELQSEGFTLTAGQLSANLITSNLELDSLKAGTRLRVGEAEIELSEPRKPCGALTNLDHRLPKRLYRRCGWLGRVVKSGRIQPGTDIEILPA